MYNEKAGKLIHIFTKCYPQLIYVYPQVGDKRGINS